MPIEKILEEKDFKTIILRNSKLPFTTRNMALVMSGYRGVTVSSIRDSGIKMMWDAWAHHNELKDFSGIKTKTSLDQKIRPHEAELSEVVNRVFKSIK